jgi:hypothetical protein
MSRWLALFVPCLTVPCFTVPCFTAGCVTEKVVKPAAGIPPLLRGGAAHNVTLYFEVSPEDVEDVPGAREYIETYRALPPTVIVPEIEPGGRERYRIRKLHDVSFQHNMFVVGGYSYPARPKASLYVYKSCPGNFTFDLRGQTVVVPSDVTWTPAVYYSPIDEEGPDGRLYTREVVQVGLATIEILPQEGAWLVRGRKLYPDRKRPIELAGAVHAQVPR